MVQAAQGSSGVTSLKVFKNHLDVVLETWFGGEQGTAGGMVRLGNLRGLFQP